MEKVLKWFIMTLKGQYTVSVGVRYETRVNADILDPKREDGI
jgi:hypothetical protein